MRRRIAVTALGACLVAPFGFAAPAFAADAPEGEMVVVSLDVAQADAAYEVGPCGETGLVVAGDGS